MARIRLQNAATVPAGHPALGFVGARGEAQWELGGGRLQDVQSRREPERWERRVARSWETSALSREVSVSQGYQGMCFPSPDLKHHLYSPRPSYEPHGLGPVRECLGFPIRAQAGQFGLPSWLPRSAEPTRQALGRPPRRQGPAKAPSSATKHKGSSVVVDKPAPRARPACPARGANPRLRPWVPTQWGVAQKRGHSAPQTHLEQLPFPPFETSDPSLPGQAGWDWAHGGG